MEEVAQVEEEWETLVEALETTTNLPQSYIDQIHNIQAELADVQTVGEATTTVQAGRTVLNKHCLNEAILNNSRSARMRTPSFVFQRWL
eukprot:3440670-Karenia_brevis.AAC.1